MFLFYISIKSEDLLGQPDRNHSVVLGTNGTTTQA